MRISLFLSLLLVLAGPAWGQVRPTPGGPFAPPTTAPIEFDDAGRWDPPLMHDLNGFDPEPDKFNSVHLSLIPKGPHRGKLLVWDAGHTQATPEWKQRWAIVDVSQTGNGVYTNGELLLPTGYGDLFCAGHAWTGDGNLFVAGGTSVYPGGLDPDGDGDGDNGDGADHQGHFHGNKLTYVYDPSSGAMGTWIRLPDLQANRWYPTVTLLANGQMFVTGPKPTYEVFTLDTGGLSGSWQMNGPSQQFPGPAAFSIYPRVHQLFSGEQFCSGMWSFAAKLDHAAAPGSWTFTDASQFDYKNYVTSVLLPNVPGSVQDRVMLIGGEAFIGLTSQGVLEDVEVCNAGESSAPAWDWTPMPPMKRKRQHANGTLLPDGSVLVIGGRSNTLFDGRGAAARVPELFKDNSWRDLAPQRSDRTYHSTALLLPDGKVVSAGGDTSKFDYEVFSPPYLTSGLPRPEIVSAPTLLEYSGRTSALYTVEFEKMAGAAVEQVVLMAPGSVTHHTDYSQRYVALPVRHVTETSVHFLGPESTGWAPPGFYMLFLVTGDGVPSVSKWVRVL